MELDATQWNTWAIHRGSLNPNMQQSFGHWRTDEYWAQIDHKSMISKSFQQNDGIA